MAVRKIEGKLLPVRYKKHTIRGKSGRPRVATVSCPKFGKSCSLDVCLEQKHKDPDTGIIGTVPCDHFGGVEFGYIICKHPKAGGEV